MEAVHWVFIHMQSNERDSVCMHNAPGPWTEHWDQVTCEDCRRVVREIAESQGRSQYLD